MKNAVTIAIETGFLHMEYHMTAMQTLTLYRCQICKEVGLAVGESLRDWGTKHLHGILVTEDERC